MQAAIEVLTKPLAVLHCAQLLEIHNSIPHVTWDAQDLLADSNGDRVFIDKWSHSRVAFDRLGRHPMAMMIAYARAPWAAFGERSLYLHRGAVLGECRRKGVGRMLFEHYTTAHCKPDGLEWITLQTNAEPSNAWVVEFYEDLGFERGQLVVYEDKTDYLMHKRWV